MTNKKLTDHEHSGNQLEIYTIYDKKAETYMRPMYTPHLIEIQRSLTKNLKDPASTLSQFPEDYEVWKLGTYNIQTAEYNIYPKPTFTMNITDLLIEPGVTKPEARI